MASKAKKPPATATRKRKAEDAENVPSTSAKSPKKAKTAVKPKAKAVKEKEINKKTTAPKLKSSGGERTADWRDLAVALIGDNVGCPREIARTLTRLFAEVGHY